MEIRAPGSTIASSSTPVPAPLSLATTLVNTANSIDLTLNLSYKGKAFYALYDADPGTMTSAQIKAASATAPAGTLVAGGNVDLDAGVADTLSITNQPDKKLYYLRVTGESDGGELLADTSAKKYDGVIPRRLSMQTYTSTQVPGNPVIRYSVYFPPGYYDNPTTEYPGLLYVGGGGEIFNDASNDERFFTTPGYSGQYTYMAKTPYSGSIRAGIDFPFVIIQPQCNSSVWGTIDTCANGAMPSQHLTEAIDQANLNFRTDPKRFYALGVSWGGGGVYNLAYDAPDRVAAVVPVVGGLMYRSGTAANICSKFVTGAGGKVAVWTINNDQDPWYSDAIVTGNGGTSGLALSNIINGNGLCAGHLDAIHTAYNDNTTFPANIHGHNAVDFSLNTSFYCYPGYCGFGTGFAKNNGAGAGIADTDPPSVRISLHPQMVTALATASTNHGVTINSIHDWLLLWAKP